MNILFVTVRNTNVSLNAQDLPIYSNHQSHLDFLTKYKPTFEDVLAFDYEF